MISKKIKIPIYEGLLYIQISNNRSEECLKLGITIPEEYNNNLGLAISSDETFIYVISITEDAVNMHDIIAHECLHICNDIFKHRYIKPDLDNDEPQAYLLGWLVNQVYRYIEKSK